MNGTAVEHIVVGGLESPESLVVDWIAHNLYWADSGTERIEMSQIDGSSRLVLIWNDIQPHAIAVDPAHGYDAADLIGSHFS
jgi:low density lipoprotein receptor-related protein 5/6